MQQMSHSFSELPDVITHVNDELEAKSLPCGAIVGDPVGGRSFNDNVAAILESRSYSGWREVTKGDKRWTVIVLAR